MLCNTAHSSTKRNQQYAFVNLARMSDRLGWARLPEMDVGVGGCVLCFVFTSGQVQEQEIQDEERIRI